MTRPNLPLFFHHFRQQYRQRSARRQLVRFIVVGILNTSVSYALYSGFLFAGFGFRLANFLSLILGIVLSFKTQGHLVFNNTRNHLFGRFLLCWGIIYLCVIACIGRMMALGLNAYTAGALTLPISVALSYLTQKYIVFRPAASTSDNQ